YTEYNINSIFGVSSRSVCVYKYVYKNHDCASIQISRSAEDETVDEINIYLDCCYICAPEDLHHIYRFPCQEKSETIYRLSIHLPDRQTVVYQPGNEKAAAQNSEIEGLLSPLYWQKISTSLIRNKLEITSKGSRSPEGSRESIHEILKVTLFVLCFCTPMVPPASTTINNSYLWIQFHKFTLLDNMRIINGDANWIKFLLDVGDGAANDYED
uniref:Uncharacterized protein n=1 Tax=Caenorhabditis japonica TaxID=281687 RepID=A0A8R1EML5_CAEJA